MISHALLHSAATSAELDDDVAVAMAHYLRASPDAVVWGRGARQLLTRPDLPAAADEALCLPSTASAWAVAPRRTLDDILALDGHRDGRLAGIVDTLLLHYAEGRTDAAARALRDEGVDGPPADVRGSGSDLDRPATVEDLGEDARAAWQAILDRVPTQPFLALDIATSPMAPADLVRAATTSAAPHLTALDADDVMRLLGLAVRAGMPLHDALGLLPVSVECGPTVVRWCVDLRGLNDIDAAAAIRCLGSIPRPPGSSSPATGDDGDVEQEAARDRTDGHWASMAAAAAAVWYAADGDRAAASAAAADCRHIAAFAAWFSPDGRPRATFEHPHLLHVHRGDVDVLAQCVTYAAAQLLDTARPGVPVPSWTETDLQERRFADLSGHLVRAAGRDAAVAAVAAAGATPESAHAAVAGIVGGPAHPDPAALQFSMRDVHVVLTPAEGVSAIAVACFDLHESDPVVAGQVAARLAAVVAAHPTPERRCRALGAFCTAVDGVAARVDQDAVSVADIMDAAAAVL